MDKLIMYSAGAIQNALRTPWRDELREIVESIGGEFKDPVGDNANIFNQAVLGYHSDGTYKTLEYLINHDEDKAAMLLKQTEENDLYYIQHVCNVIFFFYDDRAGHGTKTEFDRAFDWGKKIILVRGVSRMTMAHWNLWRRTMGKKTGQVVEFGTLPEAYEYIRKTYGKEKGQKVQEK